MYIRDRSITTDHSDTATIFGVGGEETCWGQCNVCRSWRSSIRGTAEARVAAGPRQQILRHERPPTVIRMYVNTNFTRLTP